MADPLATEADLVDRIGELTEAQTSRAGALLVDASAKVRGFCRQTFTLIEDDAVVLRPVGTLLRLPQRPVLDVTAVVAVGCNGLPDLPLAGWCWDGADKVDVAALNSGTFVSLPAWWDDLDRHAVTYRVTYDHGYAEIPEDVVAVVCAMVNRTLTAPSMVEGMVSEGIGQYRYQLQQGGGSAGTSVRLTGEDRQALLDAGYRRRATTIAVSAH